MSGDKIYEYRCYHYEQGDVGKVYQHANIRFHANSGIYNYNRGQCDGYKDRDQSAEMHRFDIIYIIVNDLQQFAVAFTIDPVSGFFQLRFV